MKHYKILAMASMENEKKEEENYLNLKNKRKHHSITSDNKVPLVKMG